jgi:hypothetical protein
MFSTRGGRARVGREVLSKGERDQQAAKGRTVKDAVGCEARGWARLRCQKPPVECRRSDWRGICTLMLDA